MTSAQDVVRKMFELGATGIAAYNDDYGMASLAGARTLKLSVPRDLAVIGVDNSRLGSVSDPPLTTIGLQEHGLMSAIANIGKTAVAKVPQIGVSVVRRVST